MVVEVAMCWQMESIGISIGTSLERRLEKKKSARTYPVLFVYSSDEWSVGRPFCSLPTKKKGSSLKTDESAFSAVCVIKMRAAAAFGCKMRNVRVLYATFQRVHHGGVVSVCVYVRMYLSVSPIFSILKL